jgi:hypothetical protein
MSHETFGITGNYFQQNAANNSHSNIGFIQRVAHFIYLFLFV